MRAKVAPLTIDTFLRYALLYLLMASYVALLYAFVILLLLALRLLPMGNTEIAFAPPWWVSIMSVALIVPTLPLVHRWLRDQINAMLDGQLDDPYALISQISSQLQTMHAPQMTLPLVAETIAHAFKAPYVAIATMPAPDHSAPPLSCEFGTLPPTSATTTLPLAYLTIPLGELVVAARPGNASRSTLDAELLADVARQIGVALYVMQLAADLQASRERLVISREEERRRIRNDLHDGLGPTLSALQLQLGAMRTLIRQQPDAAEALANTLREDLRQATTEIRQLVYALRPPLLDELGLVEAIRGVPRQESALTLEVSAPEPMPKLSAALEVALYRIASEAIHNVMRHAQATCCAVELQPGPDMLTLRIRDNGVGLPPATDHGAAMGSMGGVGLLSMRERAAELGGTLTITPGAQGGVEVVARFPLAS